MFSYYVQSDNSNIIGQHHILDKVKSCQLENGLMLKPCSLSGNLNVFSM